jgi:hypothetical protein
VTKAIKLNSPQNKKVNAKKRYSIFGYVGPKTSKISRFMSSLSHIQRVEISVKPQNFRRTLDVYQLFFFSSVNYQSLF